MKLFLLSIFLCIGIRSIAQDNIIQSNGTEIQAKVIEVTETSVRYKRFDNLAGPIYSLSKIEIVMIQYENGTKDTFSSSIAKKATSNKNDNNRAISIPLIQDSLRIKNYLFINGSFNTGLLTSRRLEHPVLTNIYDKEGLLASFAFEFGGVLYLAPNKMPSTFGLGLNLTFFAIGGAILEQQDQVQVQPYHTALGPQLSFKLAPYSVLDLYLKAGMTLMKIREYFKPLFLSELGITFRYKRFLVGLSGAYMPSFYTQTVATYNFNYRRYQYGSTHNYSHIRVRIGFSIGQYQTKL